MQQRILTQQSWPHTSTSKHQDYLLPSKGVSIWDESFLPDMLLALSFTRSHRIKRTTLVLVHLAAAKSLQLCQLLATLWTVATGLLCPWDFSRDLQNIPGKDTGVGCHTILRGCSPPRDWTRMSHSSCFAGRFFAGEPCGKPLDHLISHLLQGNLRLKQWESKGLTIVFPVFCL